MQTGNSRPLKVVGWIEAENEAETEKRLHAKYAAHNIGRHGGSSAREWFYLQPADILEDLQRAGIDGFPPTPGHSQPIAGVAAMNGGKWWKAVIRQRCV
ncbi:GIY-YIG nuclease family protein [Sphingomonas sp. JC676]|uniref:GIY-YIG nuclease family protein n=1 Tax=Sphingomonas sp. JC676 TaxID=2768065 RepID=UPI0016577753|nr:GIY-YIG nuclease family protein [Sphingomonas sp. JC676]MBC9035124.1 GIY-YIG nuclease family protein [Sphingomonas sp. JC676]